MKQIIALKGGSEYIESTRRQLHRLRVDCINMQHQGRDEAGDETEVDTDIDDEHVDENRTEGEEARKVDDLLSLFDDSEDN
jgi:transposase